MPATAPDATAESHPLLCDAEADFVVIGGVSATLHGSARVTYDLDICYSRTPANLRRLAAALAAYHPRPTGFTLHTDLGDLDLLSEVQGLGAYEEVKARSIEVPAFDRKVMTRDLYALIEASRAASREKDPAGLKELEGLLEASQE